MAPINIVYPGLSMLIYLPENPTAAVEIATPSARNDGGGRWLVLLFCLGGHRARTAGAVPPALPWEKPPIPENRASVKEK